MWRWETETRLKEYGPGKTLPVEVRSLVNDQGIRIEASSSTREKAHIMTYTGHGLSLKVHATRYNVYGDQALDAYTVTPHPPMLVRTLFEQGQLSPQAADTISLIKQDISSALKLWPQQPDACGMPIRNVVFSHFFDVPSPT